MNPWARFREALRQPFWQAVALFALAVLLFKVGVPYLPPLVGVRSAPVPATVFLQYVVIAAFGILLFVSADEATWRRFKAPILAAMVDADKRPLRGALLVILPLLAGWTTWQRVRPRVELGAQLRSIHPAPPSSINVHGTALTLAGLDNPMRGTGDTAAHIAMGRRVYYQNCVFCHGDRFDGQGHFALAFNPAPLSFTDPGTIAQLTESFVFWRVAKGGPGLPRAGTPWNSAMPVWENFLTDEEMWSVILFLYEHTGWHPRTWEAAAAEGHGSADTSKAGGTGGH